MPYTVDIWVPPDILYVISVNREKRCMKSPFLRAVSEVLRKKYYAKRTEETYLTWITSYIRYH